MHALHLFALKLNRSLAKLHGMLLALGMLSLLAAAVVLTYSVFARYFFKLTTDWQDEAAVFCLVGTTFLCAGQVQMLRGHIGIEAIKGLLPVRLEQARYFLIDLTALVFCSFFAWKSWTLCHEAWAENYTTSSSWGPPLWIPYALMAMGVSVLALQLLAQTLMFGGVVPSKDHPK